MPCITLDINVLLYLICFTFVDPSRMKSILLILLLVCLKCNGPTHARIINEKKQKGNGCIVTKIFIKDLGNKYVKKGIVILGSAMFGSYKGGGPHDLALYKTKDVIESINIHVPQKFDSTLYWPETLELDIDGENALSGHFTVNKTNVTPNSSANFTLQIQVDTSPKDDPQKALVSTRVEPNTVHSIFAYASVYKLNKKQQTVKIETKCDKKLELKETQVNVKGTRYGPTMFSSHAVGFSSRSDDVYQKLWVGDDSLFESQLECVGEGKFLKNIRNLRESKEKFLQCFGMKP